MNTRLLVMVSGAIEGATGVALIIVPELVTHLLFGTGLSSSGIAVARGAGLVLLFLSIVCWPRGNEATSKAIRALFVYNLLAGLYFGYLRVDGGLVGYLLWPACVLHLLLAILLARPAYESVRQTVKQVDR